MKINKLTIKNKILKYCAPILLRTRQLEDGFWETIPSICVSKEDVTYLTHSTFNVVYINKESVKGYFRECRKHLNKTEYISQLLDDYFEYICESAYAEMIKKELLEYLGIKKNISKFFNMGVRNDTNSAIARFYQNPRVTELLGIPNVHSKELDDKLPELLQFVWGEVYTYLLNEGIEQGGYQVFNTNRQVATYELAKCLDAAELIPYTRYVKLIIEGKEKIGTLMDVAPGICPEHMEENARMQIAPELQRQFIRLNFLDILCRHTDHRPGHDGNYNVDTDENGNVCTVSAFDNDAPTSFLPSGNVKFGTSAMTTSLITKDGMIARPYICKDIVEKIRNIDKKAIDSSVGRYLSTLQCFFINRRLQFLRCSIEKTEKIGLVRSLAKDEWSMNTVNKELALCSEEGEFSYLYAYYRMLY